MSIGKEVGFGVNSFGKPDVKSYKDSICNLILNILVMKPGNLPSLPHIGINITEYLYKLEDEIDVNALKDKIYNQCNALLEYLVSDEIKIFMSKQDGRDVLIIYLPISVDVNQKDAAIYAFSKNEIGAMIYNYSLESKL